MNRIQKERLIEKLLFLPVHIITIGFTLIEATVQNDMTQSKSNRYCKVSYRQFKEAFNQVEWAYKPHWRRSLFGTTSDTYQNYFHASIVFINGTGCLLTALGFLRACRLRNKKIKELRKDEPCYCNESILLTPAKS